MTHATDRRGVFHRLHQSGCFVIPNPWDLGSARLLTQLGFGDDQFRVRLVTGPSRQ